MIFTRDANFLTEAVGAASAIAAGGRLRVFEVLASGPLTAAELAVRCELAAGPAARLLSALTSIGVLDRQGGRHRLAVDRGVVESQSSLWDRLPEVVRGGPPAGFDDASTAADAYPSLVGLIGALARKAGPRAAVLLAAGLPDCASVLDVGAGAAAWSLALAARHPS